MRKIYFSIILLALSLNLLAMPAVRDTLQYIQPDGSSIDICLHGDEHFHYTTTPSGEWLSMGSDGFYQTTQPITAQEIAQRRKASPLNRSKHEKRNAFPTLGKQKSIVLLVQFTDLEFTTPSPLAAFNNMLNQKGYSHNGATGSARDYYLASSNGQFNPEFITAGPYTLPHDYAYYGANTYFGTDQPARLMQFCRDAVAAANDDINFAEYDTDNDGYIDNVFIYYAGYPESEGGEPNTIWPHQYGVNPDSVIGTSTFDGKTISSYACTSELKGNSGNTMCGIGTFCHEFGHVLGLPDYYHTATYGISTLGNWDIMDNGSYMNGGNTPPAHSAFNRFYLGWLSPTQINQPTTVNIYALAQDTTLQLTNQAYLIADGKHNIDAQQPNLNEYWIIEYRKKNGWDTYLPDSGLVIWHIDYDQNAWDENTVNNAISNHLTESSHLKVYIENPDNDHSHSKPAAFHNGDTINPTLWNGTVLNQTIDDIHESADYCTFNLMGGGFDKSAPVALQPAVVSYNSMRASWQPIKQRNNAQISYLFTAYTLAGGDTAYIVRRDLITDTTYLLSNLKEETIYTYYVSAYIETPDTAVETFQSNIIKATTGVEKSYKKMTVGVVPTGSGADIYVSKPNADDVLYIFNEKSQLMMTISTHDNLVCVNTNQLPSGHIYIFKAGNKYAKIAL